MADAVLNHLSASNIFDLSGVIAVVTGGGTVSISLHQPRCDSLTSTIFSLRHIQGIGLMITTTLVANGATVYIIGPKQEDLDKIAETFNGFGKGRIVGLEGDIRLKVSGSWMSKSVF